MNITLYTSFSKRKNSTKTPTGGTVVSNVELKKPTSLHDPTFVLGPVTGVTMENVTYIKAFGHYYFVNDITVTPHDYFEISCSEDPMASNKSGILASTQYVIYSASRNDPTIPDSRILSYSDGFHTASSGFVDSHSNPLQLDNVGCFILSCLSRRYATYFTTTYIINAAELITLAQYLFNPDVWLSSFEAMIGKFVLKPYDSVISLKWIPLSYTDVTSGLTAVVVELGKDEIQWTDSDGYHSVNAHILPTNSVYDITGSVTHTWHYKDDWRLSNPTTRAQIYVPGYGMTDINPLQHKTSTKIRTAIDLLTGDTTTWIYDDEDKIVSTLSYDLGVVIPIAQYTGFSPGGIAQIAGGVAALATGGTSGVVTGTLSGLAAAANITKGAADMFTPTQSVKGSQGGRSWLGYRSYGLIERYIDTQNLDAFNITNGMPLMEQVTLSTLSGYCQCSAASVELNCNESDRDYINNMLNSGFYIE